MFCVRRAGQSNLGRMTGPSRRLPRLLRAVVLALPCPVFAASSQTQTPAAGTRAGEGPPKPGTRAGDVPPKPQSGEGGWKSLFDGKTTAGWRGYRQKTLPDGWQVGDGALTRVGQGGGSLPHGEFENFDLTLDWKIAPGGNSGIFYRVVEHDEDTEIWMAAPEYQLIDDTGYPGKLKPTQK